MSSLLFRHNTFEASVFRVAHSSEPTKSFSRTLRIFSARLRATLVWSQRASARKITKIHTRLFGGSHEEQHQRPSRRYPARSQRQSERASRQDHQQSSPAR